MLSDTENKFEKMYWKKYHEYKELENEYKKLINIDKSDKIYIGYIDYVDINKNFGYISSNFFETNQYFNHNSSKIQLKDLYKGLKVSFKIIKPEDNRYKTQAYILDITKSTYIEKPKEKKNKSSSHTANSIKFIKKVEGPMEGDDLEDLEKYKYRADGNYPPYTFKKKGEICEYNSYHKTYLRCPYNCVEDPRTGKNAFLKHIKKCNKSPHNNKKFKNNPILEEPDWNDYIEKELIRIQNENKKTKNI